MAEINLQNSVAGLCFIQLRFENFIDIIKYLSPIKLAHAEPFNKKIIPFAIVKIGINQIGKTCIKTPVF
jgi:hypothetical protein